MCPATRFPRRRRASSVVASRRADRIARRAMSTTPTPTATTAPPPPFAWERQTDGTALIAIDPWLEPYADRLRERRRHDVAGRSTIDQHGGTLGASSQGHHYFGFNRCAQSGN